MNDVKQFKLANGEELVAEVLSWADEESDDISIVNPLKIVATEDFQRGFRYYTFRPWMTYDSPNTVQLLNLNHVVGVAVPSSKMVEQYDIALRNEIKLKAEHEEEQAKTDILETLRKAYKEFNESEEVLNNIIKFNPKTDKIH